MLPTAWQAVRYADVPEGGALAVFGLGPIGQMAVRIARHLGAGRVIGIDTVPERLALAERYGAETARLRRVWTTWRPRCSTSSTAAARTPPSTRSAWRRTARRFVKMAQTMTGLLPDALAQKVTDKFALDRLDALHAAIKSTRRGGTVSISGVYGGEIDPMPMMEMFDRGLQLRMGQAHVKRWTNDILPLVLDESDPLGTLDLVTHRLPLEEAPGAYAMFQKKEDGCIKVVLRSRERRTGPAGRPRRRRLQRHRPGQRRRVRPPRRPARARLAQRRAARAGGG